MIRAMATDASAAAIPTTNSEKNCPWQLIGIKVAVENHEIDIDRIQDELNGHQHRNQVAANNETANSDEKHNRAND